MIDQIPLKVRILYFLKRNSEILKAWAFPFVAIGTGAAYWPVRSMMTTQEASTTVTASTLTVMLIVSLFIIGWGSDKVIKKVLAGRHRALQEIAWVFVILLLFTAMDLMGYDVKFIPL